jgi:hypothetical protein
MQQALEALEGVYLSLQLPDLLKVVGPITALKAALEQPEQEPSQWRDMVVVNLVREGINKHKARELADHFATPPAAQTEQVDCPRCGHVCSQRPWVGLTEEEILDLFDRNNVYGSKWIEFARTVEAKLKAKNDH